MEIVLSLLTLLGLVASDANAADSRKAALHDALDQAVMLHEASATHRDPAFEFPDPASAAEREIELDLTYMELDTGFLDTTCVCRQEHVFDMRLMIAYAQLLRALGHDDSEIVDRIASNAGEHEAQVRQLLTFAGLDGIDHFICVDYLRAALQRGIPAQTLREYIDRLDEAATPAG